MGNINDYKNYHGIGTKPTDFDNFWKNGKK